MPPPLLSVAEIMAILPATVPRLAELKDGQSESRLHAPPEPGEWSANEILAHLRACQEVLGSNITRILREDRPTWKRKSPREWHRTSGYNEWDFEPAFEAFAKGRGELLAVLEPMRPDAWERVAVVTVSPNKTLEQTARFFGDWLAGHEVVHLEQLSRAVAAVRAGG